MLYKKQVFLIAFCIFVSSMLYFFGVRVAPKSEAENMPAKGELSSLQTEQNNTPSVSVNFEQLTANLKSKL